MFTIVTDNSCDFKEEEIKKFQIHTIPFYISFDGETFLKEGVDITQDDFYEKLVNDKSLYPKTSQPNPGDYIDTIKPLLEKGEDVIVFTISSKLSGSHQSAVNAVEILKEDYPNRKMIVIDSLNVSVGCGLILRELIKMRDNNLEIEKAAEITEKVKERTHVYFTLETLEYLKKGGRIGPASALVGGILNLRPILQISDGSVAPLEKVRGKKNALKLIKEAIIDVLKDSKKTISISIGHIKSEEDAQNFKNDLEKELQINIENPISKIGATIGSHVGPGVLAFAYCKKYETII